MRNSGGEQTAGARGRAGRRRDREQTRTDQVQAAECEDSLTQRHPAPPRPIHSRSPRTIMRGFAHKVAGQAAQRGSFPRRKAIVRGLAHTLTAQVAPGARFVQESRHRARIDSHIDTHNQQNQPAEGARGSSCEDSLTKWPVKQPRGEEPAVPGAIVRGFTHTTTCRTNPGRRFHQGEGHRARIHSHSDWEGSPEEGV